MVVCQALAAEESASWPLQSAGEGVDEGESGRLQEFSLHGACDVPGDAWLTKRTDNHSPLDTGLKLATTLRFLATGVLLYRIVVQNYCKELLYMINMFLMVKKLKIPWECNFSSCKIKNGSHMVRKLQIAFTSWESVQKHETWKKSEMFYNGILSHYERRKNKVVSWHDEKTLKFLEMKRKIY